jgi:ABC-type branched-subunit amino acid transport system permease subunit
LASLIFAEIFALLAIGLNIVVGFAGLLDLGYAAFFAIGAYSTGLLSSAQHNIHINFWILIWISATAAAISGLLLGAPTLGLRGDYLAIVTLGFGEIVPVAAMQLTTITIEEPLTCWIIPSVQRLLGGEGTTRCLSLFNEFDLTAGVRGVSPIDRPVLPIIHWDELSAPTGGTLVKALLMLAVMAFAVFVYTRTWRTKDKPSRGAYLGLGVVIAAVMLIFIPLPDLAGTDGISSVFNGTKRLIQPGAFKPDNPRIWYYLILALMALSIFLTSRLRRSRLGRAWTAIREDELAANQMGVNPVHAKLLAFSMGATFSGFAGAFYGAYVSGIFPSAFEFSVSVIVLCSVVLGGLGNIRGVIFGAMAILLNDVLFLKRFQKILNGLQEHVLLPAAEGNFALREAIRANLDPVKYRFLLLGLVLVLIMSFRPEGLLPSKERAEELHAGEEPNVPVPEEDAAEMPSDEEVELR